MVLSVYADLPTLDSGLEATAGAGRACLVGGAPGEFSGTALVYPNVPHAALPFSERAARHPQVRTQAL